MPVMKSVHSVATYLGPFGRAPKMASPLASAEALPKDHFQNGFITEAQNNFQYMQGWSQNLWFLRLLTSQVFSWRNMFYQTFFKMALTLSKKPLHQKATTRVFLLTEAKARPNKPFESNHRVYLNMKTVGSLVGLLPDYHFKASTVYNTYVLHAASRQLLSAYEDHSRKDTTTEVKWSSLA